jgi:hypothetical protein
MAMNMVNGIEINEYKNIQTKSEEEIKKHELDEGITDVQKANLLLNSGERMLLLSVSLISGNQSSSTHQNRR